MGFFYEDPPVHKAAKTKGKKSGGTKKNKPAQRGVGCEACGLHASCHSPKMKVGGKGKSGILILGEAPGRNEDAKGIQFIGAAGSVISQELKHFDMKLHQDCWTYNAVNCWPNIDGKRNRTPTQREILNCHQRTWNTIKKLKPKAIWLMGRVALVSYLMLKGMSAGDTSSGGISAWRGWCIPDFELGCWVIPHFHPSYIMRSSRDEVLQNVFYTDIEKAIKASAKPMPKPVDLDVQVLEDWATLRLLKWVREKKPRVAFDYETTGIKPENSGHAIKCVGVAANGHAWAFYLDDPEVIQQWKAVLRDPKIKKIAHNMKFEHRWGKKTLKTTTKGWVWDSMQAAHILDNRPGITGLKFQSIVRYGVFGYESEVKPYLETKEKGNAKNALATISKNWDLWPKVLEYCARDALLTERLANDQRKEVKELKLREAYKLFHHGALVLADVEATGIPLDPERYAQQEKKIQSEIVTLEKGIWKSREGRIWRELFGDAANLGSGHQLRKVLYSKEGLRLKALKQTNKGGDSVDQEALEAIAKSLGSDFVDKLVRLRKLQKIISTYLKGFVSELAEDSRVHPNFNLHIPRTYRGSSDAPNFQNIPIRDHESRDSIRSGIVAPKGYQFLEVDYSGVEVRVAACYHQDPTMLEYIKDKTKDMHRDMALELYKLPLKQITKDIRHASKNKFVFPEFYGSYFMLTGPDLYHAAKILQTAKGVSLIDHLAKKGLPDEQSFIEHVKKVEDDFWNHRFPEYTRWKKNWVRQYQRKLELRMHTGFRCTGPMDRKQIINYPVQGSAFHCLLWSLIHINKEIKKQKFKSRIVGQIHDSIVLLVKPSELQELLKMIVKISCHDIRDHWKWINVPLEVEAELAPVGGSWVDKKEIELPRV